MFIADCWLSALLALPFSVHNSSQINRKLRERERRAFTKKCNYLRLTQYLLYDSHNTQTDIRCLFTLNIQCFDVFYSTLFGFLIFVNRFVVERLVWLCSAGAIVDFGFWRFFFSLYVYCFYLQIMRTLDANCLNLFLFSSYWH